MDHRLPAGHVVLDAEQAELVDHPADLPEQFNGIAVLFPHQLEQRFLQREDEGRGFGRTEALASLGHRQALELQLQRFPRGCI
ncbi:hypothetical protein D9M68_972550 [compost metagenome]